MSGERPESRRARLFVALDLPEELRAGVVAWGRDELRDPALRVVAPESLHVTLAFLGYLPEREIEPLEEIVHGLGAPAPTLQLEDPIAKPSLKKARLFVLPAVAPAAVSLQHELEQKLVAKGLYRPEKRPFWPHVTVARVRSMGRGSNRSAVVERPPGALPKELLRPRRAVRVRLYRSELNPKGASYTPLAQVELSQRGGSEVRKERWQTRKRL